MTPFEVLQLLLFPGLTFFVWLGILFEWLERKTAARVQGRVGPAIAGPFGIFQPVADFLKMASKEEIIPEFADRLVYSWGPPLYFAAPAIGIAFIPVVGPHSVLDHPLDLLFTLFILSFATLMATMLGYAAAGRYATIAIGRMVVQYTGFEIPLILAMISPAILAGSLSLEGIVAAQGTYWYILLAPISFAVFIVATLAELEKPPFDIPSAKTEIVAGWMTEYSGNALAYVKLTKSLSYVFLSALAVTLFLGGPSGPVLASGLGQEVLYTAYFLVKLFIVGFGIFAIKTALARVRIEQAARLFWTVLTPLSLIQLAVVILVR